MSLEEKKSISFNGFYCLYPFVYYKTWILINFKSICLSIMETYLANTIENLSYGNLMFDKMSI